MYSCIALIKALKNLALIVFSFVIMIGFGFDHSRAAPIDKIPDDIVSESSDTLLTKVVQYRHQARKRWNVHRPISSRKKKYSGDVHNPRKSKIHNRRRSKVHYPRKSNVHHPRKSKVHSRRRSKVHYRRKSNVHYPRKSKIHNRHRSKVHYPRKSKAHSRRRSRVHYPRKSNVHHPRKSKVHSRRRSKVHYRRKSNVHYSRKSKAHSRRRSNVHYPRKSKAHNRRRSNVIFDSVAPAIDIDEEPTYERHQKASPQKKVRQRGLPNPIPIADKRYRAKEVVVIIKQTKSQKLHKAIARKYGLELLKGRYYKLLRARVQAYRIPDKRSVGTVLAQLKRDRRVTASQPNYVYKPTTEKRSKSSDSEELQYSHASMRVNKAHKYALGKNVKIAIIDTGIDRKHPEFRNAAIVQYNAVNPKEGYKGHKHGTAIAGILVAQKDIKGIAPKADLLDARAFFVSKETGEPHTDTMILVDALQWSYNQGAQIFNLSFEGPKDPLIEDALQAMYEKGRVLVGAAGNGGPKADPAYPAAYKYVIATTAIDDKNRLYEHANRGRYLSLAAPGVKVMVLSTSNSYSFESGTSIATAHVSGLVALMLERKPKLSVREISRILKKTARDLGAPGPDEDYGAGLADAYSSIQALRKVSLPK